MKLLRIKDNSQQKKEAFSQIRTLTSKIADKTLEQLEREGVFVFPEIIKDAEDITQDQMILQSVNDSYRTSNVMGFLGCGDERLIIESRFSGAGEDFFFQYLLDRVLDFPNIVDMEADANHNNRLFNFLLFLFPHYLKAAMRKGLFKKYIRRRYNDGNVKGTIDVARHIEKNTPFAGNVAYSQREFSYDNSLMELVRHTVEFIKRKPYGGKLLIKVNDEVKLVIDATPGYEPYDRQKIIEQNKKNTVRHAYFREYLALQRLCLLILRHQKHQIGTGERQIYGILFDGAWLWEEYINSLIEDGSYVLIGAARNTENELYIIRSVVNKFRNELTSIDVLYAINAKKESAAFLPLFTGKPALGTDSTISIAHLLDYVNRYFPDILPEEVLKHYGYDSRPGGILGEDALYKLPAGEDVSPRTLLSNALESVTQNDTELKWLSEYKEKISQIDAEEKNLHETRLKIKELSFAKGKRDTESITKLRFKANKIANRINIYDKQLLRLEASKPLQNILNREKAKAYDRAKRKGDEALKAYREKAENKQKEMRESWKKSRQNAVESHQKTVTRNKIKRVVNELNQLLLNGDKKGYRHRQLCHGSCQR